MGGSETSLKLAHLLPHWVEHNDAHLATFKQWAERAAAEGLGETAADILKAAELAEAASAVLQRALKTLEEESG